MSFSFDSGNENCSDNKRGTLLSRGLSVSNGFVGKPDVSNHEFFATKRSEGVWDSIPLPKITSSSIYLSIFSAGSASSIKVQVIGCEGSDEENCTNKTECRR